MNLAELKLLVPLIDRVIVVPNVKEVKDCPILLVSPKVYVKILEVKEKAEKEKP